MKCYTKGSDIPAGGDTVQTFEGPAAVQFIQPTQTVSMISEYVEKQPFWKLS